MVANAYAILPIGVGLTKKWVSIIPSRLSGYFEGNVLFYVWRLDYGILRLVFVQLLYGLCLLVDWTCFLIYYEAGKMDYVR